MYKPCREPARSAKKCHSTRCTELHQQKRKSAKKKKKKPRRFAPSIQAFSCRAFSAADTRYIIPAEGRPAFQLPPQRPFDSVVSTLTSFFPASVSQLLSPLQNSIRLDLILVCLCLLRFSSSSIVTAICFKSSSSNKALSSVRACVQL